MNYEPAHGSKRNFSVQQTQSAILTSCRCPKQPVNPRQPSDANFGGNNPVDNAKDRKVPTFCACNVKPNQTELTLCSCEANSPQKHTYSAQHQAARPGSPPSQNFSNTCHTIPLYSIPLNGRGPDGTQHSCPCSGPPPPPYPPQSELWDLQFSRWWGWNWIRRREEMMNKQQAVALQTEAESKEKKGKTYNKLVSWCCKKINGDGKSQDLRWEEKRRLQEMYDTPCSSIVENDGGDNEWECYSVDLKGECDCCCNKSRCVSSSTIILRNKTKKRPCPQKISKRPPCAKTETSSSTEVCHCSSVCLQNSTQSSTGDSIEFLSLRMERIKSEGDEEEEEEEEEEPCCHHRKKAPVSQPKSPRKKKQVKCCTCKPKPVEIKSCVCDCHKRVKPKTLKNKRPDMNHRKNSPPPSKVPIFKRYLQPNKSKPPPCSIKPAKVCKCQKKQKEYKVCCVCEKAKKRGKNAEEKRKVYVCCCCNCCGGCQPGDGNAKSKKVTDSKETEDKCIECHYQMDPENVPLSVSLCNDFAANVPQNCTINQLLSTAGGRVSCALDTGIFASPISGKTFNLNPKTFTPNPQPYNGRQFYQPIDINDGSFMSNLTPAKSADVEHKHLLQAVCNAIMSSHTSLKSIESVPRKNVANTRNEGKFISSQHSREVFVHQYDTDTTDQNEAIIDLYPPNVKKASKLSALKSGRGALKSALSKPRDIDSELLKKVSFTSLKKIYNKRTFPLKKCSIGKNLPVVEQGDSSDASPSTCNTERFCALHTPDSSVIGEEREKNANTNVYNAKISPRFLSPINIDGAPPLDTSSLLKKLDIQLAAAAKSEDAKSKHPASDKPGAPSFLSSLRELQRMNSTPYSAVSNLATYNNVDIKRLPTIAEQLTPTPGPASRTNSQTSIETSTKEQSKPEDYEIADRTKCSNCDSPMSLVFSPNSSRIFNIANKCKGYASSKYLQKRSNSKINKEAKDKRWK